MFSIDTAYHTLLRVHPTANRAHKRNRALVPAGAKSRCYSLCSRVFAVKVTSSHRARSANEKSRWRRYNSVSCARDCVTATSRNVRACVRAHARCACVHTHGVRVVAFREFARLRTVTFAGSSPILSPTTWSTSSTSSCYIARRTNESRFLVTRVIALMSVVKFSRLFLVGDVHVAFRTPSQM